MSDIITLSSIAELISENKLKLLSGLKWAYSKLQETRIQEASELLLEEIRQGQSSILDADEVYSFVAITERYFRAAQEGAARLNMRLMAKVIAGQRMNGRLSADEFLYHADILASLRLNEIILLGSFYSAYQEQLSQGRYDNDAATSATSYVLKDLVPNPFENTKEIMATAHAVTRTGLLLPHPGAIGGPIFEPTILLERLYRLSNLKDAISQESNRKHPPKI